VKRDIVSFRACRNSISEGGVGARGRVLQSLVVGDLVALELYIPVSTPALSVNSVVRYMQGRRNTGRCGLQFQSLTEELQDLIRRYCNLLQDRCRGKKRRADCGGICRSHEHAVALPLRSVMAVSANIHIAYPRH